ncbi:thioredoxin family protein [Zwartia vadi]|uniref:thioredoxin family protein n=1 Tax=Zwartia vadi TaxID=3058168 RepID=UPI0025B37B8E|nr:thioredoxin family protein [Zwartia vadi]MDN3986029.1 thioredoxin family protein [Zwartia vadi]
MTCYLPDTPALTQRLEYPNTAVVLCFCAAWCDTCKEYQPKFEKLGAQHPDACFVWVDIEDFPDLLGEEDVENFPTIAILESDKVRFMGTVLPHIEHLDRLITAMQAPGKPQATGLPDDLLRMLKGDQP